MLVFRLMLNVLICKQLNVSALFSKAEVSAHTHVHSQMSLGSNAVESNTSIWACIRIVERGAGCFEWLRLCTERESGVKGLRKTFKIKFSGEVSLNNDIMLFKLLEFLWEERRRKSACFYDWRGCFILLSQSMNSSVLH